MRFYRDKLPSVDDITTVKIVDNNEYGYKVLLLEYNNAEGFVTKSEIIKGRTRKKRLVNMGEVMAMTVLRVDQNKNTIDLSKKHVTEDEIVNNDIKYKFCHKLFLIGNDVFGIYKRYCQVKNQKMEMTFEDVMNKTIWRLYDEYGNSSNCNYHKQLFNDVCDDPTILIPKGVFDNILMDSIITNTSSRIERKHMIQDVSISLFITHEGGVNLIKKLLDVDVKDYSDNCDDYNLFIEAVSPPIYKFRLTGPLKEEGEKILDSIINTIREQSSKYACKFKVTEPTTIIKESSVDIKPLGQYEINKLEFD